MDITRSTAIHILIVAITAVVIGGVALGGLVAFHRGDSATAKDLTSIAASLATVFLVFLTVWQVRQTKKMFDEEYQRNIERFEREYTRVKRDEELENLDRVTHICSFLSNKFSRAMSNGKKKTVGGEEFRALREEDRKDLQEWLSALEDQKPNIKHVVDGSYHTDVLSNSMEKYQTTFPVEDNEFRLALDKLLESIESRQEELLRSETE